MNLAIGLKLAKSSTQVPLQLIGIQISLKVLFKIVNRDFWGLYEICVTERPNIWKESQRGVLHKTSHLHLIQQLELSCLSN